MPLVQPSSYKVPLSFGNGHLQTIYPVFFRKVPLITRERERIATPDNDFLDLDWVNRRSSQRLAILTHGLESSAHSVYMQGMAYTLVRAGWNVLAWNFRGCSGEPNRRLRTYHSGATDDLETVLRHVRQTTDIEKIAFIGFSLGGNLILKYLGDSGDWASSQIIAAVAFSAPCDLAGSAKQMEHSTNRLYMRRFLKSLRAKIREKQIRLPGQLADHGLDQMQTFREFDDAYTAPIHGFIDANDYWKNCSCKNRLQDIAVPTLLVNALDDPFLTPSCYPTEQAKHNPNFYLEMPKHGGHVGFVQFGNKKTYWSESRTVEFLNTVVISSEH